MSPQGRPQPAADPSDCSDPGPPGHRHALTAGVSTAQAQHTAQAQAQRNTAQQSTGT